MKIAQGKILQFKDFRIATLLFIAPFLSYLHTFFLNDTIIWEYLKEGAILNGWTSFYTDFGYAIYSILTYFSIWVITLFIYRETKRWFKLFLLFPLYLFSVKFFSALVPIFAAGLYWYTFYLMLLPLFIVLFLKRFKESDRTKFRVTILHVNRILTSFLLIGVIFLHELWRFFPEGTESLHFFSFSLTANGFDDANQALYYYSQRICFLIPVVLFFLIEKKWIRYALLSPIIIYATQLFNGLYSPNLGLDEIEIFQTLHFTVPLLLTLIFLAKIFDNQKKIEAWINAQYGVLEHAIKQKFQHKESIIKNTREKLKNKDLGLEGLEALKTRLEKEVNS